MNRRRLGQEVAAMAECLEAAGYNGLTKQGHEQFIKEMREIADELSSSYDVHLTYLKKSGKYYSEGMYTTRKEHMHQIFEEVRELTQRGELPGLVQGGGREFFVHIEVPDHQHNHPYLIRPTM